MRRYVALLMSAVLVGIDQILKALAIEYLKPIGSQPIISDIFHLTYVENRGAAFGMMAGQKWLLVWATAIVILAAIAVVMAGKIKNTMVLFAVATIIGGGVGNLIDRVYRGFVVDYVHLKVINFAVFNFADICVTVGTAILLIYLLFYELRHKNKDVAGETKGA